MSKPEGFDDRNVENVNDSSQTQIGNSRSRTQLHEKQKKEKRHKKIGKNEIYALLLLDRAQTIKGM